ncbi:hypothetical protein OS493_001067, partial [Desmophyllum pertusum]
AVNHCVKVKNPVAIVLCLFRHGLPWKELIFIKTANSTEPAQPTPKPQITPPLIDTTTHASWGYCVTGAVKEVHPPSSDAPQWVIKNGGLATEKSYGRLSTPGR